MIGRHEISVVIGGTAVAGWTRYRISVDMLTPSDAFEMSRPWSAEAWKLCRLDAVVKVRVDGVVMITGPIEMVDSPKGEDVITIRGRCWGGRLVQESSPAITFADLSAVELIKRVAYPIFTEVVATNDDNRRSIRGRHGKIAKHGVAALRPGKSAGARIEPGQTRWAAIAQILRDTGHIAMATGDGRLVVFRPSSQAQEPQWRFFQAAPRSARSKDSNCSIGVTLSTEDRYSRIDVVGSGSGSANHYGEGVVANAGTALDFPGPDGVGGDFKKPKRLLMLESVRGVEEARLRAQREMARRNADRLRVAVTAPMHGQHVQGSRDVTLFACDTIADVLDEKTDTRGLFRVISVEYASDRSGGGTTNMELVPASQELTQ